MNKKVLCASNARRDAGLIHNVAARTKMSNDRRFPLSARSDAATGISEVGAPDGGRLTVSVDEARRIVGLSRTTLYALAKVDRITLVKIGRRTLVKTDSLHALIAAGSAS